MGEFPMIRHILVATVLTAALAAGAAAKLPPIPKGNHYACYPAKLTDRFEPRIVTLTDQMGTYKVQVLGVTRVCMPVRKVVNDKVFEPVDPRSHLTCYAVKLGGQVKLTDVIINDQFGGHINVRLGQPNELCLPAGKLKQ
jgi:hypothetical protein